MALLRNGLMWSRGEMASLTRLPEVLLAKNGLFSLGFYNLVLNRVKLDSGVDGATMEKSGVTSLKA